MKRRIELVRLPRGWLRRRLDAEGRPTQIAWVPTRTAEPRGPKLELDWATRTGALRLPGAAWGEAYLGSRASLRTIWEDEDVGGEPISFEDWIERCIARLGPPATPRSAPRARKTRRRR